jgi:hypothetical protein
VLVLLVLALVGGLAIGLTRGGSLEALGRIRVVRPGLFAAAALAVVAARFVPGLQVPGWIAGTMLLALFAAANNRLPGLSLVLAGMALNAVVVTANGAMPVSRHQAELLGFDADDITSSRVLEPTGPDTVLEPAADVIPFPFPGAPSLISVGDVLVCSGAGLFGAVAPVRARRNLEAARRRGGSRRAGGSGRGPTSGSGSGGRGAPGGRGGEEDDDEPARLRGSPDVTR